MPIRADLKRFYGREWRTETRPRILARAGCRCERCGKPNHARVETFSERIDLEEGPLYMMLWRTPGHAPASTWITRTGELAPYFENMTTTDIGRKGPIRTIRVVLTIAHLNHTAGDDRDENLEALCQWCHLIHDREHHRSSRAARKDEARPLLQIADLAYNQ